jgi:transcriptional regulator with XRE-family HTH domain
MAGAWLVLAGDTNETGDDLGKEVPVDPGTDRTSHHAAGGPSIVLVDNRNEIRQFLTSRRARITPEQAGLPAYGGNRRVPGLRREEVALLAGMSVDYYTRLERGNADGASESVLGALAHALQLDEAERAYLFDLAQAANTTTPARRRRPSRQRIRPSVQRVLDALTAAPAYVRNGRADILAANRLAYALYSEIFAGATRPANTARFVFLSPRAASFFVNWDRVANDVVATLRSQAGRDPYDRGLQDLVGELSTRSEAFRTRWAAHNVRHHRTGRKDLHHPVVGDLQLTYEVMDLPADPGLSLVVSSAEPGSTSQDGLRLLASWAATLDQLDQTETAQAPDQA